nr:MAG TPA: leucine rich repeat protein [Caudoviricetes sp.]
MDTSKITGLHQIGVVSGAELEQLARSPYTSPRVLRELANSSNTYVQLALAENVKTPESALFALGDRGNILVQIAVASNPSSPCYLLERLSNTDEVELLEAIASNPSAHDITRTRCARRAERIKRQGSM